MSELENTALEIQKLSPAEHGRYRKILLNDVFDNEMIYWHLGLKRSVITGEAMLRMKALAYQLYTEQKLDPLRSSGHIPLHYGTNAAN